MKNVFVYIYIYFLKSVLKIAVNVFGKRNQDSFIFEQLYICLINLNTTYKLFEF